MDIFDELKRMSNEPLPDGVGKVPENELDPEDAAAHQHALETEAVIKIHYALFGVSGYIEHLIRTTVPGKNLPIDGVNMGVLYGMSVGLRLAQCDPTAAGRAIQLLECGTHLSNDAALQILRALQDLPANP